MKYRHGVLAFLFLLAIITYLDRVCISVAGPRMQDELQIGPAAWGWVTGAFVFSYALFEIPSGAMGDRIGPRRVLTRIVWWWSAFTALTGVVSNYYLLLVTRFCFGMGEAGAYPNATVVIGRWFPKFLRASASSVVIVASQVGGLLAPLLVVPVQARYGWRASFFVFGVLGFGWGIAWYLWFRDYPSEKSGVSKVELQEVAQTSSGTHERLPWRSVLRTSNLWAIMAIAACYFYTAFFFQSWFHTYLVKGRGYREHDLLLSAFPYLVAGCASGCGGYVSDALVRRLGLKWGRRLIGVAGLGVAGLFTVAVILTENPFWALVCLSLIYGGIAFQQPTVFAVCLDIGGRHAGAVTGAMNTAAQIGAFVSSVVFGYLVAQFGSYTAPFIPMAALLLIGAGLWLRVDASRQLISEVQVQVVRASRECRHQR